MYLTFALPFVFFHLNTFPSEFKSRRATNFPVCLVPLMSRDITHLNQKITDSPITMHSSLPFIAENVVATENMENLLEFLSC